MLLTQIKFQNILKTPVLIMIYNFQKFLKILPLIFWSLEKLAIQKRSITCALFDISEENDCIDKRKKLNDFFSDENVISRIQNCGTYFENIKTIAFEKVCNTYLLYS